MPDNHRSNSRWINTDSITSFVMKSMLLQRAPNVSKTRINAKKNTRYSSSHSSHH